MVHRHTHGPRRHIPLVAWLILHSRVLPLGGVCRIFCLLPLPSSNYSCFRIMSSYWSGISVLFNFHRREFTLCTLPAQLLGNSGQFPFQGCPVSYRPSGLLISCSLNSSWTLLWWVDGSSSSPRTSTAQSRLWLTVEFTARYALPRSTKNVYALLLDLLYIRPVNDHYPPF